MHGHSLNGIYLNVMHLHDVGRNVILGAYDALLYDVEGLACTCIANLEVQMRTLR